MNLESWRRFLEDLPAPATLLVRSGDVLAHNRAARELFGADSPLSRAAEPSRAELRELLLDPGHGGTKPLRMPFVTVLGKRIWLELRATPVQIAGLGESDHGPDLEACLVQWWDVSGLRGENECLQLSLEMFRHVEDAIIATDLEGVVTFWNPGAERLFGWRAEEMIGRPYVDRLPAEARQLVADHIASRASGTAFEGEFLDWHRDGSRVWIDARVTRYFDPEGQPAGIVGISHDIRLRKAAEEALAASRTRLGAILNAIPDVIFVVRPDLTVKEVFSSEPAEMIHPPEYYVGRHLSEFTPPAVIEGLTPVLERVAGTGQRERLALAGEFHGSMYYLDTHIVSDSTDGWILLVRDQTEEVLKERGLRKKIEQSRKLESLGMLAGGIAYDFESMLTAILGFSDLARDSIPPDLPASRHLSEIETTARRATELCRQLRAYAGRTPLISRPIDVSGLVSEMRELLVSVVHRGVEVEYELAQDIPAVDGDIAQLRQVLINLLTNSSDATVERGGTVRLRTFERHIESPQQYATFCSTNARPGAYVSIEVADQGSGMDPATASRIFDPFFSTKPGARGLGLAGVLGVVRGHGGLIRVETRSGEGTTVEVLLPASRLSVESLTPLPRRRRTGNRIRRVLAIDDEPAVRLLIRTALEESGVMVELARSGTEGRERYHSGRGQFDAVIVDMTLPGVSGLELVREFVSRDPELPVVVISGYSAEQVADQFSFCSRFGFVSKPFAARDLVAALARATAN